jgi:hypothetical protein
LAFGIQGHIKVSKVCVLIHDEVRLRISSTRKVGREGDRIDFVLLRVGCPLSDEHRHLCAFDRIPVFGCILEHFEDISGFDARHTIWIDVDGDNLCFPS